MIKHPFECKDALEGALRSPLSSMLVVFGEGRRGSWCPIWCLCGLEGHPEFPKHFMLAPLNPHVFASTILTQKHNISRNRVFTVVKLHFLKVGARKTKILKTFLSYIHFLETHLLATFMDLSLIYFVVVPQYVVFLVLEPLGADFELPSGP